MVKVWNSKNERKKGGHEGKTCQGRNTTSQPPGVRDMERFVTISFRKKKIAVRKKGIDAENATTGGTREGDQRDVYGNRPSIAGARQAEERDIRGRLAKTHL